MNYYSDLTGDCKVLRIIYVIYIIFRLRFKKLGMEGMTRNPRTFRNGPGHSEHLGSRWLSVKFWSLGWSGVGGQELSEFQT